jgi:hypothetical protein
MRTSTHSSSKVCYTDRFIPGHGVDRVFADATYPYVAFQGERSDVTRIAVDATGWRRPSSYSAYSSSNDAGYHSIECWTPNGVYRSTGGFQSNVSYPLFGLAPISTTESLWPKSSDVDRAVVMARNNVADRVAGFAESLAEARRSIQMLTAMAQSLDRAFVAIENKRWDNVARSLGVNPKNRKARRAKQAAIAGGETFANGFLAYNFGIKPIVSDMVGLMILLGVGKPLRVVGKGLHFSRKTESVTGHVTGTQAWNPFGVEWKVPYDGVVEAGVYVRLDYEIDNSFMRNLASFGVTDIPQLLWALTPHSFVVDFAVPVSTVLRSLTATYGLHFKGGTATRFARVAREYGEPSFKLLDHRTRFVNKPFGYVAPVVSKRMQRTVFQTEPNPVTLWVKDPVSAFTVSTVMSLMVSRFSRFIK